MKKRWLTLLAVLTAITVILAACQTATPEPTEAPPTEAPTEEPMEEPTEAMEEEMVTPSVRVEDQTIAGGQVTVPAATSDGPGWVVIHADDGGAPGAVVGVTAVSDGENTDIVVNIDTEMATSTLYAMLHTDSGEEGTYEFPDADPPVKVEGSVVVKPFHAEMESAMLTPSVTVEDQTISDGTVTVPMVVSDGQGWVVIHADQDGAPGPVVGQAAVSDGENADVTVEIDTEAATTTLYAMLHTDSGEEGTYEFPDADPPVKVEGSVVVKPFQAESAEMAGGEMLEIDVVDSSYDPVETEVSVGTTVVWTNVGAIGHTVTADDGLFDSGNMSSGDTFEYTFEEPGTYPYYCVYHGDKGGVGMAGVITVTDN